MVNSLSDYVVSDEDLHSFCSNLAKHFDLDISNYKPSFLNRRITIRMYSLNCQTVQEYFSYIENNESEITTLLESFSINVTEFFRDKQVFDFFQSAILPKIKKQKRSFPIRILSLGCATGEEVYSIAITLLKQSFVDKNTNFSVTGVDRNKIAIEFAKSGIYPESALKNINDIDLQSFFINNQDMFAVDESVKTKTSFYQQDIFDFSSPIKFDCVFFRNVMIYFDRKNHLQIFEKIYDQLTPSGFLVLGTAETVTGPTAKLFEPYDIPNRVFVKI